MPRQLTSRLGLSYGWLRGEDWWGDPVSDNFVKLDVLLNPYVLSMTAPTPPESSAVGDMYIVPVGGTGVWLGRDNSLAVLTAKGWLFASPTKGVRARLHSPGGWIWWTGTTWRDEGSSDEEQPALLGTRYDIAVFVGYEAEAREVILAFTVPEAMTLPNLAMGSVGRAAGSPLSIHRLTIKRNGVDIGTISFIPGSVNATFSVVNNKPFSKGDLLTVELPDLPSTGFTNYSATLRLLLPTGG